MDVTLGGLVVDGRMELTDFRGTRTSALSGLIVRHGAGLGGRVLATRQPALVDDYAADAVISHDYDAPVVREGLRAALAVPVVVEARVEAVIYGATHRPSSLGDHTVRELRSAAHRLGQELRIRREVERRVAAAEQHRRIAVSHAVDDSALANVREAHAQLRTLAHAVTDGDLRTELANVVEMLARAVAAPLAPDGVRLSGREVDVLSIVGLGCTNAETATTLGISSETVKTHLRSASRKLGTRSRHESVVEARRRGLLP
jgi:DNA-binding CsgD family transcriptional regulator